LGIHSYGTRFSNISHRFDQVDEFELPKAKATELLKAHDGDAVTAMKAYLQPTF